MTSFIRTLAVGWLETAAFVVGSEAYAGSCMHDPNPPEARYEHGTLVPGQSNILTFGSCDKTAEEATADYYERRRLDNEEAARNPTIRSGSGLTAGGTTTCTSRYTFSGNLVTRCDSDYSAGN